MMPLISVARKPLGMIHPALAPVAVALKRLQRRGENWRGLRLFAQHRQELPLPFRVKKHQSVLMRKLGDVDMQLQINKVQNLKLAIAHLNGILVPPGAVFSFYQLVGKPTAEKGYLPGVQLIQGKAVAGIGGGLCQLANLIHWLVLHSPLTVTERHHHSFDPFPDEGRVLPFGSGATVFYNYRDYQFRNDTPHTFQLRIWLTDKLVEGEIRTDADLDYTYHVFERNHAFVLHNGKYFRRNEIWRKKTAKIRSGAVLSEELITRNFSEVKYELTEQQRMGCACG